MWRLLQTPHAEINQKTARRVAQPRHVNLPHPSIVLGRFRGIDLNPILSEEVNQVISEFSSHGSIAKPTHRPSTAATLSPQFLTCPTVFQNNRPSISRTRAHVELSALLQLQDQVCLLRQIDDGNLSPCVQLCHDLRLDRRCVWKRIDVDALGARSRVGGRSVLIGRRILRDSLERQP